MVTSLSGRGHRDAYGTTSPTRCRRGDRRVSVLPPSSYRSLRPGGSSARLSTRSSSRPAVRDGSDYYYFPAVGSMVGLTRRREHTGAPFVRAGRSRSRRFRRHPSRPLTHGRALLHSSAAIFVLARGPSSSRHRVGATLVVSNLFPPTTPAHHNRDTDRIVSSDARTRPSDNHRPTAS